jgi:hypothetical protein
MNTTTERLTALELRFIEAWLWEHTHGEVNGPAHSLAKQNSVSPLAVYQAAMPLLKERFADVRDLVEVERPDPPYAWPWPGMSQDQICQDLASRQVS